ncbi:hypothetical protein GCM10010372_00430 [Streptomyces tauricus]|nr:hypothetical protein GCM10010372_00430 [Streptomyces tauricus]
METRETVCEETPASRATSAMEALGARREARFLVRAAACGLLAEALSAVSTRPPRRSEP